MSRCLWALATLCVMCAHRSCLQTFLSSHLRSRQIHKTLVHPHTYVMASAGKTLFRRNYHRKSSSSASSPSGAAVSSSLLNRVVFLHEWWLIKTDSDSQGRRLGVGGLFQEKQGIRSFVSATVVKRDDAVTLKTVDGMTIMVHGHLKRSRTLENGFSHKVCDHFVFGFPYDWEEYAALSIDEHEKPALKNHESGMMQKFFDDILQQNDDSVFAKCAKNETSPEISPMVSTPDEIPANYKKRRLDCNLDSAKHSGPLTRSRVRSLGLCLNQNVKT